MDCENSVIDNMKPFWDLTLVVSGGIGDNRLMDWDTAKKAVDLFVNQLTEEVIKPSINFIMKKNMDNFALIKKVIEYAESFDRFKNYSGSSPIYSISIHQSDIDKNKIEYFKTLGLKLHISVQTYGYDIGTDILYNNRNNPIYSGFRHLVALSVQYDTKISLTSIIKKRNVEYFAKVLFFLYENSGFYNYSIFDHNDYWENEDIEYLTQDIIKLQKHTAKRSCNFSVTNIKHTCFETNPYGIDSCCGAGISGFAAAPNGNIYPCHKCYTIDSDDDMFLMGDVNRGIDIAKRGFIHEINNYQKFPEKCRKCMPEIKTRCYVCFAVNHYIYGDFSTIPEEFCTFQKKLYHTLKENIPTINKVNMGNNSS